MGSEWDFTWGLTGEELIDAQSTGATYEEWDLIEREDRQKQWVELKVLRDNNQISNEEFKIRKAKIFND